MGARHWLAGGRLGLARVRVSRVRVRVVMETAQVAGTLVKSRGGTSRTASEVARINAWLECLWAGRVMAFRQYLGPFQLKIATEVGRKGASTCGTCAESKPNPRQGGDAPRQR